MSIKPFEDYLKSGAVKRITPDTERAKNLTLEVKRKIISLKEYLPNLN